MQLLRTLKPLTQSQRELNITWEIPAGDDDLEEMAWLMAGLLDLDITVKMQRAV